MPIIEAPNLQFVLLADGQDALVPLHLMDVFDLLLVDVEASIDCLDLVNFDEDDGSF